MRLLMIGAHDEIAHWLMAALPQVDSSYQITRVDTAALALHELRFGSVYDLALIDLHLPKPQKRQIPRRFKTDYPDLALVALTEEPEVNIGADSISIGKRNFLYEGIHSPEAIDRALRCAQQRHQQGEENYVVFHVAEAETAQQGPKSGRPSPAAAALGVEAENTPSRSIAHEICNELNVVALEADVIQLVVGCGESAQVDQSVARIQQKCSALAAAIRQIQFPQE